MTRRTETQKALPKSSWLYGSGYVPGTDLEEVRKRRLYVVLSLPGSSFLLAFGIYNILADNTFGGWLDTLGAVSLIAGIFLLARIKNALALYRLNTLALMLIMLYWVLNGGVQGEKSIWAFTFPLITYFMLGRKEGTIWNGFTFFSIILIFSSDLYQPFLHQYTMAYKIRYVVAYLVVSLLTYGYESAREESWINFFKYAQEKKELQERLARSQKMEALGLLAGGVAHDLNNVMFGLVSYPDFLLTKMNPEDPMFKPLKTICDSGQKAAAIVDELLTLARRGVNTTQVLSLNALIREYVNSPEFKKLNLSHTGIEIVTRLSDDLMHVKGSPLHLKKCLMNLVSNAVEALPDGGRVVISTTHCRLDRTVAGFSHVEPGDYIILQVEDNGIGIDAKDQPHIFEPFYTKKKMGRSGTGLGMAVVWSCVQDHQGYIDLHSSQGSGTKILVYLPVSREPLPHTQRIVPREAYIGKNEKILIIDDMPEQRSMASRMLTDLGYTVYTAESGEAAVSFLQKESVDLLLLDMIMEPGIDGLETYRRILKIHPNQKALLVSGYSETDRVRAAQKLGAGAYVKKPYVLEELGLAVRYELEKADMSKAV